MNIIFSAPQEHIEEAPQAVDEGGTLKEVCATVLAHLYSVDDCRTIATVREELPDVAELVPVALSVLRADGLVSCHDPEDGSKGLHYYMTTLGKRVQESD